MDVADTFRVDLHDDGSGSVRVVVRGELDLATVGLFADRLEEACQSKPPELWVDFTDLSFCDSSGLRACINATQMCANAGTRMRIVGAQPSVRRVFDAAGISDRFEWLPAPPAQ